MAIELDFGTFVCRAALRDTPVARRFADHLPLTAALTEWGRELYGPIGVDLGEDRPVPRIPAGGIAYSRRGGYVCIFFGQTPAWPVDHIGDIIDDGWKSLEEGAGIASVAIRKA